MKRAIRAIRAIRYSLFLTFPESPMFFSRLSKDMCISIFVFPRREGNIRKTKPLPDQKRIARPGNYLLNSCPVLTNSCPVGQLLAIILPGRAIICLVGQLFFRTTFSTVFDTAVFRSAFERLFCGINHIFGRETESDYDRKGRSIVAPIYSTIPLEPGMLSRVTIYDKQ